MLNLTSTMAVATRRLASSGWKPRGDAHLPGRRRRRGGRRVRRRAPRGARAGRGQVPTTSSPRAAACPSPRPTGYKLRVSVGEKGGNWRLLTVHGTPGHGSRPFRTDNALVTAAIIIQRIADYRPSARILDPLAELRPPRWAWIPTSPPISSTPSAWWKAARDMDNLTLAREAHACTHTTFSPNVAHGGQQGERDSRQGRDPGGHPRAARRHPPRRWRRC